MILSHKVVIDRCHAGYLAFPGFLAFETFDVAFVAVLFALFVADFVARPTACDAAMIGRRTFLECGLCALRFNCGSSATRAMIAS